MSVSTLVVERAAPSMRVDEREFGPQAAASRSRTSARASSSPTCTSSWPRAARDSPLPRPPRTPAPQVSLCAAFCPLPFQDTLLLEPGEPDEEPTGLVPAFETGLTPSAEMWNGRLAMLATMGFIVQEQVNEMGILANLGV